MLRWILDDEKLIEFKMNIRNNAKNRQYNRQYNKNKMKQPSQCSVVLTNVLCVFSWFFFDTKQDVFLFGLNAFRSIDFRLVYIPK